MRHSEPRGATRSLCLASPPLWGGVLSGPRGPALCVDSFLHLLCARALRFSPGLSFVCRFASALITPSLGPHPVHVRPLCSGRALAHACPAPLSRPDSRAGPSDAASGSWSPDPENQLPRSPPRCVSRECGGVARRLGDPAFPLRSQRARWKRRGREACGHRLRTAGLPRGRSPGPRGWRCCEPASAWLLLSGVVGWARESTLGGLSHPVLSGALASMDFRPLVTAQEGRVVR